MKTEAKNSEKLKNRQLNLSFDHGVLWRKLGRKSISKGQTTFFWDIDQYENTFSINQKILSSRFRVFPLN